jgi:hypothetical protein
MKKHSNNDAASVKTTIIGIMRMYFPMIPGNRARGRNAAAVVKEAVITGTATSCVPLTAACIGGSPFCICR